MKIFIATPMSSLTEEEYYELQELMERISQFSVNEIYTEIINYKKDKYIESKEALEQDLKEIDICDKFILIYPKEVKSSVFLELGYALAKEKDIEILTKNKKLLPFLTQDLNIEEYISIEELETKIISKT